MSTNWFVPGFLTFTVPLGWITTDWLATGVGAGVGVTVGGAVGATVAVGVGVAVAVGVGVPFSTVLTVNARVTGAASLPAASFAFTDSVCGPAGRAAEGVNDGWHVVKGALSRLQENVVPGSPANVKVGVALSVVPEGPSIVAGAGGCVSITNVRVAGVESGPAAFVA